MDVNGEVKFLCLRGWVGRGGGGSGGGGPIRGWSER